MYRHKNGTFKSKKFYQAQKRLQATVFLTIMALALMFGFAVQYGEPIEYVRHVEAYEPTLDPCGLSVVVCEGETDAKVQKAIDEIPHQSSTTEKWIAYLYTEAEKAGVDQDPIAHAIYCESMWYCQQSNIVKNGVREPSYCIGQIHAPSHPDMTYDQLNDPYHNIDYMLAHFENDVWYGYSKRTDTCNSGVPEYWN